MQYFVYCVSIQVISLYFQIIKMECQVEKNVHFRYLLLFAFNRGFTVAKAAREICVVYGENAMAERTARYWFAKFKEENFDLKDAPRSGRPTELDEGQLNQVLHEDSRQTARELAERMNCSHTCIEKHLHLMGKVQKCGVWVPHTQHKFHEQLLQL